MRYLLLLSLCLIGINTAYSPSKAVSYAKQWAYGRNPNYYDYDPLGGDCANFVSQCLIAGGFSTSGCTGNYGVGGTLPLVTNLENCLVQKGWRSSSSMPSKGMPVGSVITFYNGGHATIVVQGGTNPLVAAHNNDVYGGNSNYGYGRRFFWDPDPSDDGDDDKDKVIEWFPYVDGYDISDGSNGFAGDYNVPVVALKVKNAKYAVHELGGGWITASDDGVAGRGKAIDGVAVQGGVEYRVHLLGGNWLEPVHKYDLDDEDYGFAGILGRTIDAIAIEGKTYASGY